MPEGIDDPSERYIYVPVCTGSTAFGEWPKGTGMYASEAWTCALPIPADLVMERGSVFSEIKATPRNSRFAP